MQQTVQHERAALPKYPDYVSTSNLPDDKGKALLNELSDLYGAIETLPKPRHGPQNIIKADAIRHAEAELKAALVKAAALFEKHREFTDWLCRNDRPDIEAYDPVRSRLEMSNAIDDLKWRVGGLEESNREIHKLIMEMVVRLPPEEKAANAKQQAAVSREPNGAR